MRSALLLLISVLCAPVVSGGRGSHFDKMTLIDEYLMDEKQPPSAHEPPRRFDHETVPPGLRDIDHGLDERTIYPGAKQTGGGFDRTKSFFGYTDGRYDATYDDDRLDINDDMVLHVHTRRRKNSAYGQAPGIPSLTDITFPTTVYDPHNILTVVLFYSPFDAVGMLFLDPYRQAGKELAARKGGHSSSRSHPLARVNCYDWTDVCRKQNITTYPVIHLYQHGKWREQYRHALDKDVLVRTVILLQWQQPLQLTTLEEVEAFMSGDLPSKAYEVLDNCVLLKPSAYLKEMAAYVEVVRRLETQLLFAIVSPDVKTDFELDVGVLHVRWDDQFQSSDTLSRDLQDPDVIHRFLTEGQFHLLPELTFLNFPELHGRGHPLGVLFYKPSHPDSHQYKLAVVDVIQFFPVTDITFCMMAVHRENPMAERILTFYTGKITLPTFVIVDHQQGEVYALNKVTLTDMTLWEWLMEVQTGNIPPTSHLEEGEWRPVGRHYDYLAMMDKDGGRTQEVAHDRDEEEAKMEEILMEEEERDEKHELNTDTDDNDEKEHQHHANQNDHHRNQNQNQHQNQHQHHPNQNEHHHKQNEHHHNQHHPNQYDHHKNQHHHHLNQHQHHLNQNQHKQNQDENKDPRNRQVPKAGINQQDLHPDHNKGCTKEPDISASEKDGFKRLPVDATLLEDEGYDRQKEKEDWSHHNEL